MLVWSEGPPKQTGLAVVRWMNAGGFQIFDIREFDGILFAFGVAIRSDHSCTRLDKWAIKQHCMVPHPDVEFLETAFSRSSKAEVEARREMRGK